jgi:hypothetical protein
LQCLPHFLQKKGLLHIFYAQNTGRNLMKKNYVMQFSPFFLLRKGAQRAVFCRRRPRAAEQRALMLALGVAVALALSFSALQAQTVPRSPKEILDSKGKDIWLAFPRNHHDGLGSFDRLYISIAAERATRGKIEYTGNGRKIERSFFIAADNIETFEFSFWDLELSAQGISRNAFHITADEEVTVYGLNMANTTSDAFLAFPTDVLGKEYIIASYTSNVLFQTGLNMRFINRAQSTMSQFAVLAVADSTIVRITPKHKTWSGDSATYSILLNEGEGYLVSVVPSEENVLVDFTGSRVSASKPVAVYGGHERAAIPSYSGASRDHLVEQMLPVEVWGKTAFIAPYPTPASGRVDVSGRDFARIIAGGDSCSVWINGRFTARLQAGEIYDFAISTEALIVTSEPAAILGYKASGPNFQGALGDPFLAAIPPAEQFLTRYRFVCVQGTQPFSGRTEPAFQEHYVSIVVPTTKATTVVLDGSPVSMNTFQPIANTGYSYANIALAEGAHSVQADTAFGVTVLGYGRANSYGYIGGQRFERDLRPPEIVARPSCRGITGTIYDSALADSKLFFYDTLRAAQQNLRFRFGDLPRPADSLAFEAELINPYEDGFVGLIAVDSLELRTVKRIVAPGFTVHMDPSIRTEAVVSTSSVLRLASGKDYCFRLNVTNYGSTRQSIESLGFARRTPEFFTPTFSQALVIEPNTSATIEYCFRAERDGFYQDTLTLNNGCRERKILALQIEAAEDKLPPEVTRSEDDCRRVITLESKDDRRFDAGLAEVAVETINMSVQQSVVGDAATAPDSAKRSIRLTLTALDPRADAVFSARFVDSVGNVALIRDTVPGFTLRFFASPDTISGVFSALFSPNDAPLNGANAAQYEYRFSGVNATSLTCGTIMAFNTGIVPFVLEQSFMRQNLRFSFPPSQFPFVVLPGELKPFTVCFNPERITWYRDTALVSKFCVSDEILLWGEGLAGVRVAGSRCDADIRLSAPSGRFGVAGAPPSPGAEGLQVAHFPDPADNAVTLRVEIPKPQTISLRLYSMTGAAVASLPAQRLNEGVWDITLALHGVETGAYICEILSDNPDYRRWTGLVRIAR